MMSDLPLRLLCYDNGQFSVIHPRPGEVEYYDIISYTWGKTIAPWDCSIRNVTWGIQLRPEKLDGIKRLMQYAGIKYLWCDGVCMDQENDQEKALELPKMYQYYKNARTCHILLDIPQIWKPQDIVDDLKFVDHILGNMDGATLAAEARLTGNMIKRLEDWATEHKHAWAFPVDRTIVRSAGVDLGVLNCYATCINRVRELFRNEYFTRVWTFQEMILGKNITLWATNPDRIDHLGELETWMDLATDSKDKAYKLAAWIDGCRVVNTVSVNTILRVISEDKEDLDDLQMQVRGIHGARADIITGGALWWRENYQGVNNIFSAISLTPRHCGRQEDLFRGLLGVFSGLFSNAEVLTDLAGSNIDNISFNFFKQLSLKTGFAWSKLAISRGEREEWDWIPKVENAKDLTTTDCFAGVVRLGRLKPKGHAKTPARTSIKGVPRQYMKIRLSEQTGSFQFYLKGCNCGKSVKAGMFRKEPIPTHDQPVNVVKDETGRFLVQCATILGAIMDPGQDVVAYRKRLLGKLRPYWTVSDPTAKPDAWVDRCVSGTFWENPHQWYLRTHNMSMNYRMVDMDIARFGSRLANESTAKISCEVTVNCGCKIVCPFPLLFEAISAVKGSFLGDSYAIFDDADRIELKDGVGLVQVGDIGKTFKLVAFGGDVNAHRSYASSCKSTKVDKEVVPKVAWPSGRVLVREEFEHGMMDRMRDYGYVKTGGLGNLLLCRSHPLDPYRIRGVCIDEDIHHEKSNEVHVR